MKGVMTTTKAIGQYEWKCVCIFTVIMTAIICETFPSPPRFEFKVS